MITLKRYIKRFSLNNLRLGSIISKTNNVCTVQVGIRTMTATFAAGEVGQIVTIQCPDGDDAKGFLVGAAPIGIGVGGNVAI